MKEWRYVRFLYKKISKHQKSGRISAHSAFFRKKIILCLLILLIALPAQTSFAERTVYVLKENTGKTTSSEKAMDFESFTPKEILDCMSLEQKIAQMLMPSVRDEDGGGKDLTELTPVAQNAIEKYSFCGYLFFSQNCLNIEQMTRLTASMQRTAVDQESGIPIPLLLTVDQEGGMIERISNGTQTPGNMALGASGDTKAAESVAEIIGREMRSVGFNADCAPVLDVNSNPNNPVIQIRSFGGEPELAAEMGSAFIKGIQKTEVLAMLKHFPGHGNTSTDSHTGLPLINTSLSELEEKDLIPFRAGIEAGADMIMTAHIEFPLIEKDTYTSISTGQSISLPATLSDDILTGLLRQKMGYDGVIVTDAIKMDAIRKHFDPVDAAELAINAGVDIILNPGDITTEKHVAALENYIHQIASRVEKGSISEATIDEAVLRILNLKEKYGILGETEKWEKTTDADVDDMVKKAEKTVGSTEHGNTVKAVSEKTVTLVKNENQALPLSEGKTVILCPEQEAADVLKESLIEIDEKKDFKASETVEIISYSGINTSNAASHASDAENVIAISVTKSPGSTGKNTSANFLRTIAGAVHQNGGKFILISACLPYDAAAFQEADAIMLCYGYRTTSENPEDRAGENSVYGPNLPAAIRAAFGLFAPSGSLPVEIPRMDSNNNLTEEILYPAGYGIRNWNREHITENVSHRTSPNMNTDTSENEDNEAEDKSSLLSAGSLLNCGLAVMTVLKYLFI